MISTVDCCVVHPTPNEERSLTSGSASLQVKCTWANRYALMADVLENRRPWPYDPSSGMIATNCSCAPLETDYTEDGQLMHYEEALVTIKYDRSVAVSDGDGSSGSEDDAYEDEDPEQHEPPITDVMSEAFEPYAEFLTLDPKFFRWGDADGDPLLEAEAPGMLQFGAILVRTLYQVQVVPSKALSSIGHVNDGNYTSKLLGVGFAPETLLYMPPSMERTLLSDGTGAWTLTMRFNYRPTEWNKYWRAKTNAWSEIYIQGAGTKYRNYPKGNFSGLLF